MRWSRPVLMPGVLGGERQSCLHPAGGFWPDSARTDAAQLHPPARADQAGGGGGLVPADGRAGEASIEKNVGGKADRDA